VPDSATTPAINQRVTTETRSSPASRIITARRVAISSGLPSGERVVRGVNGSAPDGGHSTGRNDSSGSILASVPQIPISGT
jgi:hypothetical protein